MAYFDIEDIWVDENDPLNPSARFTVTLSETVASTVSVTWSTDYTGSASGSDYTPSYNNVLTFAPGVTSRTIDVGLPPDTTAESLETFDVRLFDPVGAFLQRESATAVIVDNDTPSTSPRILVEDALVDEADGTASVVVRLDAASGSAVTVNYATANGSALAGGDYVADSGTLTFQPGQVVKTVRIGLLDDGVAENSESFSLQLSGASGGQLAEPRATVVVADNDGGSPTTAPQISVADVWVGEREPFATFVATLSQPSSAEVSVSWSTDYTGSASGMTISPPTTTP